MHPHFLFQGVPADLRKLSNKDLESLVYMGVPLQEVVRSMHIQNPLLIRKSKQPTVAVSYDTKTGHWLFEVLGDRVGDGDMHVKQKIQAKRVRGTWKIDRLSARVPKRLPGESSREWMDQWASYLIHDSKLVFLEEKEKALFIPIEIKAPKGQQGLYTFVFKIRNPVQKEKTEKKKSVSRKPVAVACSKIKKADCLASSSCNWIVGKGCRKNSAPG